MVSVVDRKWKIFGAKETEAIPAAPFTLRKAAAPVRGAVPEPAPAIRERTLPKEEKAGKAPPPPRKTSLHVAELEHALRSTKEQLQTTIEELETANEELGSTNEELQSSNEELQSTIEEMETAREELQSVNEELTTINAELQSKADEASQNINDMNNLIASTQIANIFLDGDLRIKRFTPAAVDVANLVETDIGRPFSDFSLKLDYPELQDDIEESLRALVLKERVVRHHNICLLYTSPSP